MKELSLFSLSSPQSSSKSLAEILCLSDLHIYLSVPFVLSWSVLNAMACARVVLASDVPSVREFIEPERTGLIEPLFDVDRLCESALRVLRDPNEYRPLGQADRHPEWGPFALQAADLGQTELQ